MLLMYAAAAADENDHHAGVHWNRSLLCSRASIGFFSEACTMLFCLVSLLWVFVVSHDWKPSNEADNTDVRHIRADAGEPVFWLVLTIGCGMVCFTLYTLRKVRTRTCVSPPPRPALDQLHHPSSPRAGKTLAPSPRGLAARMHAASFFGCFQLHRGRLSVSRVLPSIHLRCQRHLSGGAGVGS